MILSLILFSACAYLLGAIPSAVWIGRSFYKIDVRDHGSGNAGTTNVLRVLGPKAAVPVFAIDITKGAIAVLLGHFIPDLQSSPEQLALAKIIFGTLSIVGHMYPVFADFRGGKGVATMLGVALAIAPYSALVAILVFSLVFAITRYVSLGSMLAGLSFPITTIFVLHEPTISLQIFALVACLLLIYTHRKNVQRLYNGIEPKTKFKKKNLPNEE
ncbi:MAG: glycerol-3-phosphate 1-O-acyltransferase PlsY [Bacteroidales bacterium]